MQGEKVDQTYGKGGLPGGAARLLFAGLCILSLAPVLMVQLPAMVDYINHLARMYILTSAGTPAANPSYQVEWAVYPNLAMDLIVPRMARFVSVELAARLFLLASQILIVSGAILIERVVKGRVQLSGFAALMFLYSLPFTWGFVNFEFGLGVALWGIAAMLAVSERGASVRFGVNLVFVFALFAAHFFALGIYGATLGFHELWRAFDRKAPWRDLAVRLGGLAVPATAVVAFMALSGGGIGYEGTNWFFPFKVLWPFWIMNGYSLTVSSITALVLIGFVYAAVRRRMLVLAPAGVWLAIGLLLLYLAVPSQLFGTSFVDLRIIVAAGLILPAFATLALPSRSWRIAAIACVGFVTLANLAVVTRVWLSYRADYASMIQSFATMEKGARILVAHSGAGEDPPLNDLTSYPIYHAPTLAVHYARAFVPNLFTAPGKQPVRVIPSLRALDYPEPSPLPIAVLAAISDGRAPAETPSFIRTWYCDFDYAYVLGPQRGNPMPARLTEVARARRFILYRIRRAPPPGCGSAN